MSPATFNVFVRLPEEHGTTHCVVVAATDTVKTVLGKAAEQLRVEPDSIILQHESEDLDLGEKVTATALVEGSEVEARMTEGFLAKTLLGELKMGSGEEDLEKHTESAQKDDGEKATVARLILAANEGVNVAEAMCGAAQYGLLETVQVLSARGVDSRDSFNATPLQYAASAGHLAVVQYLVEAGADIAADTATVPSVGEKWTPLHCACEDGHIDVVKYLVDVGADIRATTSLGRTPQDFAQYRKHTALSDYLASLL